MPVQFNAMTLALQSLMRAFEGGYTHVQGSANALLCILVTIEVALLGLWTALAGGDNLAGIFKKVLQIGAWVFVVQSYPTLVKAFVSSLVHVGLAAGGGADASLLFDPSKIAGYGLTLTSPLSQTIGSPWTAPAHLAVYIVGYLIILGSFFIMALQVFMTVVEYYLFKALVLVFLPFGVFGPTRFLAEKAVGAIVSAGVKMMVMAFLLAVINPVFANMKFAEGAGDISFNELFSVLLTALALALVCWRAPGLAAGLLSGSPHLGAGDVAGAAVATSVTAYALGRQVVGKKPDARPAPPPPHAPPSPSTSKA